MFTDEVKGWLIVFVVGFVVIFLALGVITVLMIALLHSTLKYSVQLHELRLKPLTAQASPPLADASAAADKPPPRRRSSRTPKTSTKEA